MKSRFWNRITDGMAISALWEQLRHDTRSSYQMYAQSAADARTPASRQRHHVRDFLWAIVLKMSPARRVVLVAALLLLIFGGQWAPLGVLLILGLLALEIADRVSMKRDLEIAREIQIWLLPPQPPLVAGAEVAFTSQPANTVSGDFYDAFYRENAAATPPPLLLVVADVAGKGLPAALLTATFQASLRTLAGEPLSLDALTTALNRYACGSSAGGTRFTTAFLAEYDPATRRLRYCNAGHNPPLLRRGAGGLEKLDCGGLPLGILEGTAYECAEIELRPGDVVVIYSDGMTESFDPAGVEYGEARLIAALEQALSRGGASATALLGALVEDCARFRQGVRQSDDLTCLLLRVEPGSA